MEHDLLSERMAAAARELEEQVNSQAMIEHGVDLAVANIPGADAAGIAIVDARKHITTEASTDEMVVRADALQYECGEGPCLDSIWKEETTLSPSLADDRRWPKWAARVVVETGAESAMVLRLFTTGVTLGALSLYSRSRDAFDEVDKEEGVAIAAHIAVAVAAGREIEWLGGTMNSRVVVGQALGIIMERFAMDDQQAFALLARLSSTNNVRLHVVAASVVGTRRLPGDP